MSAGRPTKFKTADQMQKVIDEYFDSVTVECNGVKSFRPTVTGLAHALDMSRSTLIEYSKKDEFSNTVKKAKQQVAIALESALYGTGVAGVIFNLKNNFGWKDKQEIDQTTKVTVVEIPTEF